MDGDARLHGSFFVEWCNPDVDKCISQGFQVVTYVSKKIVASTATISSQYKVSIFNASTNQIKP